MANPFSGGKNSEMYKGKSKDSPSVMARQDFSDEKIGPNMARGAEKKEKPKSKAKSKAKPEIKMLKDTSSEYFTADGMTGDIGKREMFEEGETAPAYKKGGKVSSASKRADGCAVRGKTRA